MTKLYIAWWIVWLFLLARFGRGRWSNRNVDRPQMKTISSYGDIELRTMPSVITASVDISSEMNKAMSPWFQILAGYIFGGNTSKDSIAMTAPVTSKAKNSEKIAMTAPVITSPQTKKSEKIAMTAPVTSKAWEEEQTTVSFVMPEWYTLDTLPIPDDTRISFQETQPIDIYVWSFDGYTTNGRWEKQLELFKAELEKYDLKHSWAFTLAQYNDPRTPPMMRLNEWWVEIE